MQIIQLVCLILISLGFYAEAQTTGYKLVKRLQPKVRLKQIEKSKVRECYNLTIQGKANLKRQYQVVLKFDLQPRVRVTLTNYNELDCVNDPMTGLPGQCRAWVEQPQTFPTIFAKSKMCVNGPSDRDFRNGKKWFFNAPFAEVWAEPKSKMKKTVKRRKGRKGRKGRKARKGNKGKGRQGRKNLRG